MATKKESQEVLGVNDLQIFLTRWEGYTFTATSNYTLTSVFLYGRRAVTTALTVEVEVYAADGAHKPNGPLLASGSILRSAMGAGNAWFEVTLGAGCEITSGLEYCVVATSGEAANRTYIITNTTVGIADQWRLESADSGGTWSVMADDPNYQNWGDAIVASAPRQSGGVGGVLIF